MLAGILSLQGVTASMMRDTGWHTIEAGRYLERSLQVCTLLAGTTTVSLGAGVDRAVLGGVLMAAESSVTHRRRYRGNVRVADVLELLLADIDNPRSLAFSLERLRFHLATLPASTGSTAAGAAARAPGGSARGEQTSPPSSTRTDGHRPHLEDFLADIHAQLHRLADAIVHLHFAAGPTPQPLSALSLIEVTGAAS